MLNWLRMWPYLFLWPYARLHLKYSAWRYRRWERKAREKYPPLPQEADDPSLQIPLEVREMFAKAEAKGAAHGFFVPPKDGGLM